MAQLEIVLFFFSLIFISACTKPNKQSVEEETVNYNWRSDWEVPEHCIQIMESDKIHPRVKDCLEDTNFVLLTSTFIHDTASQYATVKSLGDINSDSIEDSIMVVPELFYSEETGYEMGASIVFTDKTIPRIKNPYGCIYVEQVFPVADIDEDGIMELGRYFTSCASRTKGLDLLSLKNGEWQNMGRVTFDTLYDEPPKEERIRKTGNGRFEMRQIMLEATNTKSDEWIAFEMKQ